ncbi:chorismate mutase [Pelosinus fermentans]|uniref:chorismate mutase n=1 Tax=Pelosinus fermentans JBW45 TaxID=1192197 RepID=I8U2T6_9FIRM|nr:chorismate mutase [Pelosinus fermentans]AJQ27262.1 chorismate mutase [Pelosinus fermentans JBW45]
MAGGNAAIVVHAIVINPNLCIMYRGYKAVYIELLYKNVTTERMINLLRGIRGATTVVKNESTEIIERVTELLTTIVQANEFEMEDIGAVIFSSTPDINATFPAIAARNIGWTEVPLFGTQEIDSPNGVPQCIRVLILLNTDLPQKDIKHIYLREAVVLRQDLKQESHVSES